MEPQHTPSGTRVRRSFWVIAIVLLLSSAGRCHAVVATEGGCCGTQGVVFQDRAQIAVGLAQGLSDRQIGELLERDHTIIWRERRRDALTAGLYKPVSAEFKAADARQRWQPRMIWVSGASRSR